MLAPRVNDVARADSLELEALTVRLVEDLADTCHPAAKKMAVGAGLSFVTLAE